MALAARQAPLRLDAPRTARYCQSAHFRTLVGYAVGMTDWDARYAEPGWAFGTEPNDFLREQAHELPRGRVLCLAEGEGRNAVWLAGAGL